MKLLYAEMFKQAAKKAEDAGDFRAVAVMLKEAAKIDGAYDKQEVVDDEQLKKPRKVVINVKKLVVQKNGTGSGEKLISDIEDTTHEIVG
ncbi:hypothetical protein [Arsenicibacter rosenii]|uniref:Uncharacterized protein n=1 Tax=Arsenicibacter rosenii TaxID=1750698 RepID=A0A1S2V9U2_9BACT|nr:hypothetical protein [Arsenicibacter rosenii]OIN55491.1 hypothetical protein BLX24_30040 [Arsenicibacter rosenii]